MILLRLLLPKLRPKQIAIKPHFTGVNPRFALSCSQPTIPSIVMLRMMIMNAAVPIKVSFSMLKERKAVELDMRFSHSRSSLSGCGGKRYSSAQPSDLYHILPSNAEDGPSPTYTSVLLQVATDCRAVPKMLLYIQSRSR